MQYRFRKPELVPTLVMAAAVLLMFGLGVWQLHRLQWKTTLITNIEKAQSEAPKYLLSYPVSDLAKAEWHNITVTGTLLYDKELYATPRYYQEQLGYAILTPLAVVTPTGPRYVLVNRGWVPPEKKDPKTRARGNTNGFITVEGVIRVPQPQGMFRPDNNPARNLWFWYDLPAMAKYTGLPLLPIIIDATKVNPADGVAPKEGPIPFPIEVTIRNDHLGYAITWFLIGLSGLVIYVLFYLEKKEGI